MSIISNVLKPLMILMSKRVVETSVGQVGFYFLQVGGQARTRCHDGVLLPFRARCNKVSRPFSLSSFFLVTITSYSIISSWYCHKDYDDDEDEDDDNDDDNADAQVKECSNGEDEFDCDWHKRSTVDTVSTRDQFER